MFARNKVFRDGIFLNNARSYFLSRTSNFIDDEEFFVSSDIFEWENTCFPYEDYSTCNLNEMTESDWTECLTPEFRFGKRDILMWELFSI